MSNLKHLRDVEDSARLSLAEAHTRAARIFQGLHLWPADERDGQERRAGNGIAAAQDRYEHAKYKRVEAEGATQGEHVVPAEAAP